MKLLEEYLDFYDESTVIKYRLLLNKDNFARISKSVQSDS